ncbi:MAG: class I SAM-dependent methyltransferase [Ktedonobacteraceae bacterium]
MLKRDNTGEVPQATARQLSQRRGDYGFDAPYVPIIFTIIGLVSVLLGLLFVALFQSPGAGWFFVIYGLFMLLCAASYVYSTRRGKFEVWAQLLTALGLRGDEQVLDLGCGRGAVLLMVAGLLPQGKAYGVDLWRSQDQSGNALEVTQQNAELEGVAERIELHTADMQQLPFADGSFDVVLSSLAIHNIPDASGRAQAISEAVRVLKPGGRLLIADFRSTQPYVKQLQDLDMSHVNHHMLDWRFWFGGPWAATKLLTASKPA